MTTLKSRVYHTLKEQIVNLELAPGTPLVETEISERLGVSRTPVREAIRMLEREHLATNISPRITVVTSIDTQDVKEIYEVRVSVEVLALEMSFARIDHQEVREILAACDEEGLSEDEIFELDMRVHGLWIGNAKNKRLIEVINLLEQAVERYRHYSYQVPSRVSASIEEHKKILNAILMDDLPRARTYLSLHLESTKDNIVNAGRAGKNYL